MATGSTTLTASSRVLSSLFGTMETNYWSRLTDAEKTTCFGTLSHLIYKGKTMWNVAGCLEKCWKDDLSVKVAEISNHPNNLTKIYGRRRRRAIVVTDMYLFGQEIGLSAKLSRIAQTPCFEAIHHEVKVDPLARHVDRHAQMHTVPVDSSLPERPVRDALDDISRRTPMDHEPRYHSDSIFDEESRESQRLYEAEGSYEASESVYDGYSSFNSSRSASTHSISTFDSSRSRSAQRNSIFDSPRSQSAYSNSTFDSSIPRHNQESLANVRLSNTIETQSLCGSRVVTAALPAYPSSNWHRCTIGGVILLGGKWYGMTVAHPFFETAALISSDSDSTSLTSSDTGQDEDCESDSQNDGENTMQTTPSISQSSFGVYLEEFGSLKQQQPFPTAASFSRLGATSVLSSIGTFNARKSFASKHWSSELDWALVDIYERRFMSPNRISTRHGTITPSLVKKKQDLKEANVIVASGVSDIIYTQVQSAVAQIILPWSNKMQEVWKIECICAPGDCGAWVICPDTGAIYGIVIAASPALRLTYIIPAELVFENLMTRWDMDASRIQELFFMSPATVPTPAVTTTLPLQSKFLTLLSSLDIAFVSIPVGEYEKCRRFILANPGILGHDPNLILREAIMAHRVGKFQYARSCIQQALLIRELKDKSLRKRQHFFGLLDDENPVVLGDFIDKFDATLGVVRRHAATAAAPTPQHPASNTPATYSQALGGAAQHTRDESLSLATSRMAIQPTSDRSRYNPASFYQGEAAAQGQPDIGLGSHHRTSDLRRPTQNPGFAPRTRRGTFIRGTEGERDLDPSYTKRRDAKNFFRIGRVFALLWHEPAGGDRGSATSFRGENVYTSIRRMAVVRDDIHDACWAIPIHTYGNKGVGKSGLNKTDIQGHAVIYMTGTSPYTAPSEPKMSKTPIRVDSAQGQELEPMSRINFTRIHTVEHEVKVLNIGLVSKISMADFERYWVEMGQLRNTNDL